MSTPMSDQEQIQMLKSWWNKYGTTIVIAIFLFFITNYGWRYWQNYKIKRAESASVIYNQMAAMSQMGKKEETSLLANHLMQKFKNTPYAVFAAFAEAKEAVQQKKLNIAEQKLQWAADNGSQNSLKQISRIRLARVLLADKKPEQALAIINKIDDPNFSSAALEVHGDILKTLGKKQEAHLFYERALAINNKNKITSPLLSLKIKN